MPVICVDAGTTVIKAVGYDDDGSEVIVARRGVRVDRPLPDRAEQDMLAVWQAVAAAVREVRAGLPGQVVFLALTAQGDGAWLVDAAGEPTGPAVLWNDGRAGGIVREWEQAGLLEKSFELNGSLSFAGLPNAILTWFRRFDPARLSRSHKVLTCGGWVFSRMTGVVGVDESDASAPFTDIRARAYSEELLRLYDMQWAQSLLPEVIGQQDRVAPLSATAAQELGLAEGMPVVLAPYDIASTAIGTGATEPGQACSILGTTICTEVVVAQAGTHAAPTGLTVVFGVEDRYLRAFPTLSGGEVITWACELLGLLEPDELGALASTAPPGAGGLAFQPYLCPAGERTPFLDSRARGALLGLGLQHGRAHVARAVLEGLSLVVRDCLEVSGARPHELRVCGGGAASTVWRQLIADVTGIPVIASQDREVGARGAYAVGLVATGAAPSAAAAVAGSVRTASVMEPDAGRNAVYDGLFSDFREMRDITSTTWPILEARLPRTS